MLWFRLHRTVQSVGLVCTLAALVVAVVMTQQARKSHFGGVQGKLGLVVTLVGVAQPLNALFRPPPQPRTRARRVSAVAAWLPTAGAAVARSRGRSGFVPVLWR